MKRNLKLILFVLGCLMATGSYAQKVVVENGKVIIDASGLRNSTTEKKATDTDGTLTALGTNDKSNLASKVSDETVYYKFEVSKTDISRYGDNWLDLLRKCKELQTDGGGWRLPTSREFLLMVMYLRELELAGITPFAINKAYIAATETDFPYHNWNVYDFRIDSNYSPTYLMPSQKNSKYYNARCIREIPPPTN